MTNRDFYQLTDKFFDQCRQRLLSTADKFYAECVKTMTTKGQEYSGSDDKFANFKRLADLQEIPMDSIWFTYFTKHYDSLVSFIS